MAETYQQYVLYPRHAIELLTAAQISLQNQYSIMTSMRALTVSGLAASTQGERDILGTQFLTLANELDTIVSTTTYNGNRIFADTNTDNAIDRYIRSAGRGIQIWNDPSDNIFGSGDVSGTHHINVHYGIYDDPKDAAAFDNGTSLQAFTPGAPNYTTIQFGQMDTNGLFKRDEISVGSFLGLMLTGPTGTINPFYNPGTLVHPTIWGPTTTTKIQTLQELIDNLPVTSGSTYRTMIGSNLSGLPRIQAHLDYTNNKLSFMRAAASSLINNTALPRSRRNIRTKVAKGGSVPPLTSSMQQQYRQYMNIGD